MATWGVAVTDAQIVLWLQRIIGHEGGYSDNPDDPGNWTGGRVGHGQLNGTNWGIAANTYPEVDIKNLTVDQAAQIYRNDFVRPLRLEDYADGVAYQLLDFAVNSGPRQAKKSLQKTLGLKPDGIIGPLTRAALAAVSETDLIMLVVAERLEFMTRLKNWPAAGRGWARRIAQNLRYGALDA